ncbi:YggS family pyridoxal phosphate-dependent enzyme [Chitinimonas arctica]|uniref:Pyridoxal phosphate homeostasis protein n=1 Tax=Chitinimonas arctica TaxID=2594795 RepID=A0A516SCM9_9NEIS|nr:YggS family pyridoxal phosphate-dependent enzyme [Chitinimonas arctica]QDQ25904.1 YggS family pyridoxal phosphate-dependent enzyme [Chitinimonas arctica]
MPEIENTRLAVLQRIDEALRQAGREPGGCGLLAVSKTFPVEDVRACHASGQRAFGENYVQELLEKLERTRDLTDIEWHFIGPLQSNKTRPVAESAHWVHSVDRLKIAERLSAQRPAAMPPLNVCVQVNVSGEASKSGCAPAEAKALAHAVARLPGLRLRGLMCIPEPDAAGVDLAGQFGILRALHDSLRVEGLPLDTLSMGMSADLEIAVAAGATMVRVGTALFGRRPPVLVGDDIKDRI